MVSRDLNIGFQCLASRQQQNMVPNVGGFFVIPIFNHKLGPGSNKKNGRIHRCFQK